ncbi:glycosyltransferase family 39 protein [Kitasatospora sp. SUK 42]|uniref:glycosyltransferase family 39 protein n=1 Tax=Kitasatospora sp. SUK 42 TaxID=1588882 RepID=UPI0018CBEF2A|nr:glycosyltransferase family 39 protein [Kitasatospora sp. SUK 42]MBV2152359.1 glycosyltransferase family 39 protein [Kitasatospora sp. SUK 42]
MRPAVRPAVRLLGQVWFWPALVMLGVGGYRLGTPEPWRDEIATWAVSTRSLDELVRLLGHIDASNGAYYLLMHGWTSLFGDSVVSLRIPSVLAMAGAAAFVALTAERLFGGRVAAVGAGLLFTVAPQISHYAQEARAYALATCAVAAATYFLLRALERPGLRRWAPYCVSMALAGVWHLVSFTTVAGQLALVLLHLWRTRAAVDRRLLWHYPVAVAVAALPVLPVVLLGTRQSGRQLGWIATPSVKGLLKFGDHLFGSAQVSQAFLLLALAALVLSGRRAQAWQALLLAELPVVAVWLVSRGETSYFIDRYLLFTVPAWAVLAGGGVGAGYRAVAALAGRSWAPRRIVSPRAALAAAGVVAVGLLALPAVAALPKQPAVRYVGSHTASEEPFREVAEAIAAGYRPGDGLAAPMGDQSWAMVWPGVSYHLPPAVHPFPVFVARSAEEADELTPEPCPQPASCLGDGSRIWLIVLGDTEDPLAAVPQDQAQVLLDHYGTPDQVTPLGGLTLALLDRDT